MSLLSPEQIAGAQQANLDTSLGLVNTALEGFRKLIELNLQAARSAFAEAQGNVRKALSVKDPQELAALQTRLVQVQPTAENVRSYSRQALARRRLKRSSRRSLRRNTKLMTAGCKRWPIMSRRAHRSGRKPRSRH